jgi:hypothetical protein
MKVNVEIDVTPQEARTFFGLPDVKPLQDEMLDSIRQKMRAGVEGFDPLSLLKPFLPQNMQTVDMLQKSFWKGFSGLVKEKASTEKPEKAAPAKKKTASR